jgi:hypothetical protein
MAIPKREEEVQRGMAQQENLMMSQGMPVQVNYYDDDYVHIQVHRELEAQIQQTIDPSQMQQQPQQQAQGAQGQPQQPSREQMLVMMLEQHIQAHAQAAAAKHPTQQDQVPQAQGGHGIEAQNGQVANQQGLAQTASGQAPIQ